MLDSSEFAGKFAADSFGGGVRGIEFGELFFQFYQLRHQAVVVLVGNFRRILDVVEPVMAPDLGAQRRDPFLGVIHYSRTLITWPAFSS